MGSSARPRRGLLLEWLFNGHRDDDEPERLGAVSKGPSQTRRSTAKPEAANKAARRATFGPREAKNHLRQSSGRPLDSRLRREFEPLLGADLSSVLVHDDEHAQAAARGLGVPAFVHRAHVAFAGAAPAWRSGAGRKLWAHELAHAAQFIGTGEVGSADEINRFGDSAEGEARAAAEALIRGERYVPRRAPENEFQPFLGDAADWVADTASDAVDWAGEQVDDAIEWTADQLRELIPDEVLEFVEDVSSVVQEWIEDGFAAWLEDVLAQVSFVDSIQPFFEAIGKYAGDFNNFGTTISETAGEALSPIFEPIVSALSEWINPALEAQISTLQSEQEAQDELEKELFEQDAQNIQGVVDSIRDGVEDIWDTITEFLSSIPGAEEAWEWLKEAFNFVVDTIEEIVDWVMEQVSELWEWVSEAIEPIKPALEMIAKILFILSPLGPIYILMEYGPQLWEYITEWFGDFDLGSILTERLDTFTDEVLPFFRNAVRSAAGAVAAGIEMVIPVIDTMLAGAEELTGFEIEWLAVLRVWLRWVASEARKFAKLTDEQIKAMMDAAVAAFTALAEFLGKLVDFFVRLVMVVLNPFMLPFAITGVLWLLLPDAFKPPIIDFILNLIIIASMEFPTDLFGLGPLGPVIKAAIVAFFMSLKEGGNLEEVPEPKRSDAATERKINATNKIASIAAGGGVQFVAGYFVGLLEGIWTGLSDPFVLIWDLLSFVFTAVGKLLEFVHHMGEQMFEGGGESRGGATGAASGPADLEPDVRADMSAEEQAALDEVMTETANEVQPEGSMPSQETLDELGASEEAGARIGEEFEASRDEASSTEGIDVERIMNWLWSVRTRMREGAASLGAQIAEAFYDFIEQSDFQLGRSLGNVAGQILFEIILGILTAGGWTALSVAKPFIKVGAKIAKMLKRTIRPLIRLIKRLRGPVSRGMTAIGDILRQIPGMRGIIDRIEDAMRRMMRYVDEFEAPPRRSGGTPDATPDRPPRDRTTSDSDRPPRDSGGDPDRNRTNDPDRDPNRHPDDDDRRRHRDDDEGTEDDRRRLRRAVAAIGPRVNSALRHGIGKHALERRLARWRIQYRLTSLRLQADGDVYARVNPGDEAGSRAVDVHDEFRSELRLLGDRMKSRRSSDSDVTREAERQQQYAEQRGLDPGDRDFSDLQPGSPNLDYQQMAATHDLSGATVGTWIKTPGGVYVTRRGTLAATIIQHGGAYGPGMVESLRRRIRLLSDLAPGGFTDEQIIRLIASNDPTLIAETVRRSKAGVSTLTGQRQIDAVGRFLERKRSLFGLEGARMPEAFVAQPLSAAFEASRTTPDIENLFAADAPRGPMTAQGASMLPTDNESSARRETRESGTAHRNRAIDRLFDDLADAARDADVLSTRGQRDLGGLVRAIHGWAELRVPHDAAEIEARRRALRRELIVFLENYSTTIGL